MSDYPSPALQFHFPETPRGTCRDWFDVGTTARAARAGRTRYANGFGPERRRNRAISASIASRFGSAEPILIFAMAVSACGGWADEARCCSRSISKAMRAPSIGVRAGRLINRQPDAAFSAIRASVPDHSCGGRASGRSSNRIAFSLSADMRVIIASTIGGSAPTKRRFDECPFRQA